MACKVNLTTPSGFSMPILGFGTWQAKDSDLEAALETALEAGYRHIDTATAYENEHVIGKVLKKWMDSGKLKRDDLFITTKLPSFALHASDVDEQLSKSLKNLQLSYVDLYLIHSPYGFIKKGDSYADWELDYGIDHSSLWKAMEKQVENGKAKAIGVSNFNNEQVERLLKNCKIPPANNQVEMQVYYQRPKLVEFHKKNNVTITSYATLGSSGTQALFQQLKLDHELPNLMENPVVVEIANKHKKTPAQVLLRHMVQKGIAVIPKSTNPERVKQNLDVFNFELSSEDMERLSKLDINQRLLQFDKLRPESRKHPEYPFKDELD